MGSGSSVEQAHRAQIHGAATHDERKHMNARMTHKSAFIGHEHRTSSFHVSNAFLHSDGDKLNGHHTKEFKDGSSYTGSFVNGHRHGQGRQEWKDGGIYDGEWENDRKHGDGALWIFANGNTYNGPMREGHLDGVGKMTYASGDVYQGDFGFAGREGQGKCTFSNGAVYDGHWHMDKPHGKGVYSWEGAMAMAAAAAPLEEEGGGGGGAVTVGGIGLGAFEEYRTYTGDVFSGHLQGSGMLVFADGSTVYEGQMHADHATGKGTFSVCVCVFDLHVSLAMSLTH